MQILRFSYWLRLFHWAVAIPTLCLLTSGICITLGSLDILHIFSKKSIVQFHITCGSFLLLLPLLVFLLGKRKAILAELAAALRFQRHDIEWIIKTLVALVKREGSSPPAGKYNSGQKLNALASVSLLSLLFITGITMSLSSGNILMHGIHIIAFVLFLPALCVHLFMALINPSTRVALGGMFHGYVPVTYLQAHHSLAYDEYKECIIGDIVVQEATSRKDLHKIYTKLYQPKISFSGFKRFCAGSECVVIAKREERILFFCRVVGDGVSTGFIIDSHFFMQDMPDATIEKIGTAIQHLAGHPLQNDPTSQNALQHRL